MCILPWFLKWIRFIDVSDIIIWKALELIKEYKFFPRDGIHAATVFIAGAETIILQDADFDNIKAKKKVNDLSVKISKMIY